MYHGVIMFSFFKRKKDIVHPVLKKTLHPVATLLRSDGKYWAQIKEKEELFENNKDIFGFIPFIPISLFYSKGKLRHIRLFRPTDVLKDKPEYFDMPIHHVKGMPTIPMTIHDKSDLFIQGQLLYDMTEFIPTDSDVIAMGLYGILCLDPKYISIITHMSFLYVQYVDGRLLLDPKEFFEKNRLYYYLLDEEYVRNKPVPIVCDSIKERNQKEILSTLSLYSHEKDKIEVSTRIDGVIFFNKDKSIFEQDLMWMYSMDQQEIAKIKDIEFINGTGNIVLASINVGNVFKSYLVESPTQTVRMGKSKFNKLKPSIGDTVMVNLDENGLSIIGKVSKGYGLPVKSYPKHCPICNAKLKFVTTKDDDSVGICDNNDCLGTKREKIKVFFSLIGQSISTEIIDTLVDKVIDDDDSLLSGFFNIKKSRLDQYCSDGISDQIYDTIQTLKRAKLSFYINALVFMTTHRYVMVNSELGIAFAKAIDRITWDYITFFEDVSDLTSDVFRQSDLPSKITSMLFNEFGECRLPDFEEYDDLLALINDRVILSK